MMPQTDLSPCTNAATTAPRPSMLLFHHVAKTGGSTVREWLLRNAGKHQNHLRVPKRLDGVLRYYEARCFFCMQFRDVLGSLQCSVKHLSECRASVPRLYSFNSVQSDWRCARLAVEFHGMSVSLLLEEVLPELPRLRREYQLRNGTITVLTLMRAPIAYLLSAYRMWPPQHPTSDALAQDFPSWLRQASGLQAAQLAPRCFHAARDTGMRSRCPCSRSLRFARRTLDSFDIVGATCCLGDVLDEVERRMHFPPEGPLDRMRRRAHQGNVLAGPLYIRPRCMACGPRVVAASRLWTWEALSSPVRRAAKAAAQCDMQLYHEVLTKARSEVGGNCSSAGLVGDRFCSATATI